MMNLKIVYQCILSLLPLAVFGQNVPIFDKGKRSFSSFIVSNQKYPSYAKNNCIQGIVIVGFKLDKNGKVSEASIKKGTGVDLDDEALRLVYLSQGKWTIPSGYDATQTLEIPIQFKLSSEECMRMPKSKIQQAIINYQAEQTLFSTIANFYKAKRAGKKVTQADEVEMVKLSNQLGVDEAYLEDLLKEAKNALRASDIYTAKIKAFKIRDLGSTLADAFILEQGW